MHVVMMDPGNYTPYYVANLSHALTKLGFRVDLVTSTPFFEAVPSGDSYGIYYFFFRFFSRRFGKTRMMRKQTWLRQGLKALSYSCGLWQTWQAFKDQPPGILHMQWALLPPLDLLLLKAFQSRGWRIVYTDHDLLLKTSHPYIRWQLVFFYQNLDAIIVHTQGLAQRLTIEPRVRSNRIHIVPMGNLGLFRSPDLSKQEARYALGLDPDRPLLLFFGLIKPYKGLEYLLRAMPKVRERFHEAVLLIAGEPMGRFGYLRKLFASPGIRESIILRLGYVPNRDLGKYFCAADMVVLPYTQVSLSAVLLTAYSYGRPVITTNIGALPELVEEGHTGFIVPPRSPEILAEAICRGLEQIDLLIEMGTQARERAEKYHNWFNIARQTSQVYQSCFL